VPSLVIVGSGDLWVTPEIMSIVIGKILNTPPIHPLGVRVPRGADEPTTPLERFVAQIGPSLGRVIDRNRADTNQKGDVWRRDYDMVEHAVAVLAFFAPDQEMEGGTGHVVQAALARNIPVEAYRLGETGRPELLGSDDGVLQGGPLDPSIYNVPGTITFPYPPSVGTLIWTGSGNYSFNIPDPHDHSTWRKP